MIKYFQYKRIGLLKPGFFINNIHSYMPLKSQRMRALVRETFYRTYCQLEGSVSKIFFVSHLHIIHTYKHSIVSLNCSNCEVLILLQIRPELIKFTFSFKYYLLFMFYLDTIHQHIKQHPGRPKIISWSVMHKSYLTCTINRAIILKHLVPFG